MVYIVGHRGAPLEEPENTIESFKKAIGFGVDFFECDVHLTKDGEIVVIHDATLERTTDGKGYVKDYTLSELKKLTVGGKYRVPTLREVLKLDFPLAIELKAFNPSGKSYPPGSPEREIYPDIVTKVMEVIKSSNFKKDLTFASYDKRYLEELNNYPEFKKMLISRSFPDLDEIKGLGLSGLVIEYHALNAENVNRAHKNNLKVLAWAVDNQKDIEEMIRLKVDYIASNDPKLAVETVK